MTQTKLIKMVNTKLIIMALVVLASCAHKEIIGELYDKGTDEVKSGKLRTLNY